MVSEAILERPALFQDNKHPDTGEPLRAVRAVAVCVCVYVWLCGCGCVAVAVCVCVHARVLQCAQSLSQHADAGGSSGRDGGHMRDARSRGRLQSIASPLLLPAASSVPGACILDGHWLQHLLTTVVRAVITRPQAFPSFRAQFNAVKWGDAAGLRDVLVQFQRALLEHEQETGQVGGVLPVCLCACLGWLCVFTQLPRVPYGCTAHAVRYRANTASNGDDSEGHCGRHVTRAGTRQPVCRPGVLHAPSHTHDG